MKRIGMKKASYMFFFLVMGMIFAAGCSKKPGEGGDIILSSADNTQSQENTGTTEPAKGGDCHRDNNGGCHGDNNGACHRDNTTACGGSQAVGFTQQ